MPNMSYCRFENTANDLQNCIDNWDLMKMQVNMKLEVKNE
jgi:hypothetical protein